MRWTRTRTSDIYRVNFEVNDLKPFPHLAFPHSKGPEIPSKLPSFDGELMASLSDLTRSMSAIAIFRQPSSGDTVNSVAFIDLPGSPT